MNFWENFWEIFWWFFFVYAIFAFLYALFMVIADLFRDHPPQRLVESRLDRLPGLRALPDDCWCT